MSGHNKWSKIKNKKALTDAKKSKVFSKFVKLIQVESKKSGGDINSPGLRVAIEKAKAENMPSSNIERAIAKGKTDTGANMEHLVFETYGPGGSAIIIEALTDNNNRTAPEIKHILAKHGLQLASPHSATWAFDKVKSGGWQAKTPHEVSPEDLEKLEELIEELEDHDDVQGVYTNV
jgi:YebC/PmpR family DNA-binding regulatory protein